MGALARLTEAATKFGSSEAGGMSKKDLIDRLADVVQRVERLSECSTEETSAGGAGARGLVGRNLLLKSIM